MSSPPAAEFRPYDGRSTQNLLNDLCDLLDVQRYVAQHERDAHCEQHLRQVVFSGSANEEAVDQVAERDDSEPAAEHAKSEATGVEGNRESDVAAD